MPLVDDFFEELDSRWGEQPEARIRLRTIGSSALMLRTNYERGTKDSDVLETNDLTHDVKKRMLDLAGLDSPSLARRPQAGSVCRHRRAASPPDRRRAYGR